MARASDSSRSAALSLADRKQAAADRPDAADPSDDADDALQVRVPLKAGLRQVVATIVKSEGIKAEGLGPARVPIWNREGDVPSAELSISSLLIGGPYNGRVPDDSPSRRRIFVCQPGDEPGRRRMRDEDSVHVGSTRVSPAGDERGCRRRCLVSIERARAGGDFDTGIRAALERLLVSPDFLFRIEADPDNVAAGTAYRLSDVELASRLSFFLWSSIPDEELLDLAIRGKLRDAGVLDQQVRRMLADPRARARAGGQLLRPVAADAQRLAADARCEHASSPGSTTTCASRSSERRSCSSTIS